MIYHAAAEVLRICLLIKAIWYFPVVTQDKDAELVIVVVFKAQDAIIDLLRYCYVRFIVWTKLSHLWKVLEADLVRATEHDNLVVIIDGHLIVQKWCLQIQVALINLLIGGFFWFLFYEHLADSALFKLERIPALSFPSSHLVDRDHVTMGH